MVLNAYLEGYLEPEATHGERKPPQGLSEEERCVLDLLLHEQAPPRQDAA